jgi:hypothetical protein
LKFDPPCMVKPLGSLNVRDYIYARDWLTGSGGVARLPVIILLPSTLPSKEPSGSENTDHKSIIGVSWQFCHNSILFWHLGRLWLARLIYMPLPTLHITVSDRHYTCDAIRKEKKTAKELSPGLQVMPSPDHQYCRNCGLLRSRVEM